MQTEARISVKLSTCARDLQDFTVTLILKHPPAEIF